MKSLVIYFSRADENYFGGSIKTIDKGNTEVVSEFIKEIVGADLFKVERKVDYSKNYNKCIQEAKDEMRSSNLPEIKQYINSISDYDVIFIGGPIYWGTLPQPMFTQLKKLDFNGKIIMPFSTHEGSGLGSVERDLKNICVGANVKPGLAILGSSVYTSKDKIKKWIDLNI